MEEGSPAALNAHHIKKGENNANSSVALGNTNPSDHPDHAAAPLTRLDSTNHLNATYRRLK
jgi:hypothetical protein